MNMIKVKLVRLGRMVRWVIPSRRRHQVLLGLTIIFLAVIAAMAHWLSAPATGHQVATDLKPVTKSIAAAPQTDSISGQYFTLTPPAGFRTQTAQTGVAGLLYLQTLVKQGDLGSVIATVAIKVLPDGGLEGDSNYTLRERQPERYHLTSSAQAGETVHIANDAESAAVVAFWPHGAYLATISITTGLGNPAGNDNSDELRLMQGFLAGWQWR